MACQYFVIGAGSIGQRHHANLTALGANSRLLGWRGLDLGAFESTLAKSNRAAVVVATATNVRFELIDICGRLGVPMYVEKPLAFRRDDLERLRAAAEPVAERSVLGYMMRYHPAIRALAKAPVEAYGFHLEIGHDVRQWRKNWRFADSYAAQADGGGVLLDLCHELDIAHCLFPGLKVLAVDCLGHADFPGVDFASRITLGVEGGPVGTVAMDYLSPKSIRRLSVRGRDEVVDLDLLSCRETRWRGGEDHVRDWTFERNDMFLGLMTDFIALVEGGELSGNPMMPVLARSLASAGLIADVWEAREFHGVIEGGFE